MRRKFKDKVFSFIHKDKTLKTGKVRNVSAYYSYLQKYAAGTRLFYFKHLPSVKFIAGPYAQKVVNLSDDWESIVFTYKFNEAAILTTSVNMGNSIEYSATKNSLFLLISEVGTEISPKIHIEIDSLKKALEFEEEEAGKIANLPVGECLF